MPQPARRAQSYIAPPLAAGVALLLLAGCEASRTIADYPVPDDPALENAAWPRLVDGPTHAGGLSAAPDPAEGAATASLLTQTARDQATRAEALAPPVVDASALRADAARARAGR